MDKEAAIKIDNLTVRFGGRKVVQRFGLCLEPGDKVTLTGRSGSGKSTVLHCILGFVESDEGAIYIEGERLTRESVWRLRTRLAYVAQEPDVGFGRVREILERPFAYRVNAAMRGNLSRTPGLFDLFMLPTLLLDKDIATLSGGEKQRVAIISSVLLERRIFLLDEASSALDDVAKRAVAEFFGSRGDLTVLSVSHDTAGFDFSDRVVELPGGSGGAP